MTINNVSIQIKHIKRNVYFLIDDVRSLNMLNNSHLGEYLYFVNPCKFVIKDSFNSKRLISYLNGFWITTYIRTFH